MYFCCDGLRIKNQNIRYLIYPGDTKKTTLHVKLNVYILLFVRNISVPTFFVILQQSKICDHNMLFICANWTFFSRHNIILYYLLNSLNINIITLVPKVKFQSESSAEMENFCGNVCHLYKIQTKKCC
jgi:hypothetical protein